MQQIRLYVMSGCESLRKGLSAIFASESSFCIVGESDVSQTSLSEAQAIQPDAILLEKNSITDCAELIKQVKEFCPYTKVFLFFNSAGCEALSASVLAITDGCLSKTMLPCHLVKAVELGCRAGVICLPCTFKTLLTGGGLENVYKSRPEIVNGFMPLGEPEVLNGQIATLTARENEIFHLIVQNNTNKEIGKKLFISQPTVKSHVSSILRKLGLSNRTQLVLAASNRGDFFCKGVKNEGTTSSSKII